MQKSVEETVQQSTGMELYACSMGPQRGRGCPFMFPVLGTAPMPAMLMGAVSALGEDKRIADDDRDAITSKIEIAGPRGAKVALSTLNDALPVGGLAEGLRAVATSFREQTLASTERFVTSYMDGIAHAQANAGMVVGFDTVRSVVMNVTDAVRGPNPSTMSEAVRFRIRDLEKKREERFATAERQFREREQDIDTKRRAAANAIVLAVRDFVDALSEAGDSTAKIATELIASELEFRNNVKEISQYADVPSHRLPLRHWLRTQQVDVPDGKITCYLSGKAISDDQEKNTLYVSTKPLGGSRRVFLYRELVKEIVNRCIYGTRLFGRIGEVITAQYGGIFDVEGISIFSKRSDSVISRRTEDEYCPRLVASKEDVLRICSDPKIAPWVTFAQTFSVLNIGTKSGVLPSEESAREIFDSLGMTSDLRARVQSKYDAAREIATRFHQIPEDFKTAYVESVGSKDFTKLYGYNRTHPHFLSFFVAFRETIQLVCSMLNVDTFNPSNPLHV